MSDKTKQVQIAESFYASREFSSLALCGGVLFNAYVMYTLPTIVVNRSDE
ncbi:hypothetical protein [Celerinatantimonas sp. MCCC 1A17872]